jgi:branched-chain amino acid transport system permease protein
MNMRVYVNKNLPLIIGFGCLMGVPLFIDAPYVIHVFIMIFFFGMVSVAWNILGGLAGQYSLGHASFMAIGAYVSSMLVIQLDITPWIGMWIGGLFAGVVASCFLYPCFILRGPYFSLATIAFGETLRNLFTSWDAVGKAQGILLPIYQDAWYYMQFSSKLPYYYIGLALLVLIYVVFIYLDQSKLGYAFKSLREDEDAANAIGINTARYKLAATFISVTLTAVAGAFYAQYVRYVEPDLMLVQYSVEIILPAIVGGVGTAFGPIIGSFILTPLSEYLRVAMGSKVAGAHLIVYALILMGIIRFSPSGIVGWLGGKNIFRTTIMKKLGGR